MRPPLADPFFNHESSNSKMLLQYGHLGWQTSKQVNSWEGAAKRIPHCCYFLAKGCKVTCSTHRKTERKKKACTQASASRKPLKKKNTRYTVGGGGGGCDRTDATAAFLCTTKIINKRVQHVLKNKDTTNFVPRYTRVHRKTVKR